MGLTRDMRSKVYPSFFLVWSRIAFLQGYGLRLRVATCCRISLSRILFGTIFRSQLVTSSPGVRFCGCLLFCLCTVQLRIVAHAFLITRAPLPISLLFAA